MSADLLVTVFVLLALTIPAAIGGVFVFRGTYYKSLPGRVRDLEADAERKDLALKRQAEELELWKAVATQTPEIREMIEILKLHDTEAAARHQQMDKQHADIMGALIDLRAHITERKI